MYRLFSVSVAWCCSFLSSSLKSLSSSSRLVTFPSSGGRLPESNSFEVLNTSTIATSEIVGVKGDGSRILLKAFLRLLVLVINVAHHSKFRFEWLHETN